MLISYSQTIQRLYESIKEDLLKVEDLLERELSSEYQYINRLTTHLKNFAGKRIRPAILLYSAKIFGAVQDIHIQLAAVVEILHNAALVHDDVLDEALIRRNVSTINKSYGNEQAVILGDYLFSKALKLCALIANNTAMNIIADTTHKMCLGESLQLSRKFKLDVTEEEYLKFIEFKTSSLFETACRLGGVENDASDEKVSLLSDYGKNIGIAFQIIDDCLDIMGEENVIGKSLGTDISKGKLTLPVILLLYKTDGQTHRKIHSVITEASYDSNPREQIRKYLLDHNIIDLCIRKAQDYIQKGKGTLKYLKDSVYISALNDIADFVVERNR